MRCEAQPRSEVRRTSVYVERAPEVATKQIAKRVSPEKEKREIGVDHECRANRNSLRGTELNY